MSHAAERSRKVRIEKRILNMPTRKSLMSVVRVDSVGWGNSEALVDSGVNWELRKRRLQVWIQLKKFE